MRLVADTNVLVSAFLWQGTPGCLIDLAGEKEIALYSSRALVDELSEVLHRKKFAKQVTAASNLRRWFIYSPQSDSYYACLRHRRHARLDRVGSGASERDGVG